MMREKVFKKQDVFLEFKKKLYICEEINKQKEMIKRNEASKD